MRAENKPTANPAPRLPVILGREAFAGGLRLQLSIPPTLDWFAGHFPEGPVLPGVAQVGWAITYAREHFGVAHDPVAIDRVKFLQPVPLDTALVLELRGDGSRVDWQLLAAATLLGSGRLLF